MPSVVELKNGFSSGGIITNWVSYTPVTSNFPIANNSSIWRRIGDSMDVCIDLQASGVVTGTILLSLPTGYSVDFTKMHQAGNVGAYGHPGFVDALLGLAAPIGTIEWNGSNGTNFYIVDQSRNLWDATHPFTWAANAYLTANFRVPIVSWSASG